jgi:hypothetical protein
MVQRLEESEPAMTPIEALEALADPKRTPSDGDPAVLREFARDALARYRAAAQGAEPVAEVVSWPDDRTPRGIVALVDWDKLPEGAKLYTGPSTKAGAPLEGCALVAVETLKAWKSMVNTLAVLSLKSERTSTAVALKTLIQGEIDAAPAAATEREQP